jgi:hypothetical protein
MVVIKGGGATYQITSGKQVPWEEVPDHFKKLAAEQTEIEQCVGSRMKAQQCIEDHGFWAPNCVELTEAFHLCQANELRQKLPPRRETANSTK